MNLSKKNHSDHWYSSLKKISQLEKHLTVYCLVLAYCILYPYSPFEDLGNSRGLNLPILQQLWNSMGRAIIYNYLSIIIPWDTSRGMPFLCINVYIYHIENSGACYSYVLCIPYWNSRGKRFVKYIKMPWIQGGNTKPWHLQGALSIIIWKYKGWDVSKLGIPWVWENYQEYPPPSQITWNSSPPYKTTDFQRRLKLYLYIKGKGFLILNRGCTDIKLLIKGQNFKSKTWVDTVAYIRIYRQYSDCIHSLSYFIGNLWLCWAVCLSVCNIKG